VNDDEVAAAGPTLALPSEPADRPTPRSPGRGAVMLIVAGLMLVTAIGATVIGFQSRSAAAHDRKLAAKISVRLRPLARRQRTLDDQRAEIDHFAHLVPTQIDKLIAALGKEEAAQRRFEATAADATDLLNRGDYAGATAIFRGDGAKAMADVVSRDEATVQEILDATDVLADLQSDLRG
jgi:hypothetical protein